MEEILVLAGEVMRVSSVKQEFIIEKIAHRILERPKDNLRSSSLISYIKELAQCSTGMAYKLADKARKRIQQDLQAVREEQEATIINKTWQIHEAAMGEKDFRAAIQALKLLVNVLGLEKKALEINVNNNPTGLEDVETAVLLKSIDYAEEVS